MISTEVPLDRDDHAHKDLLLQQYGERIEKCSQQDRFTESNGWIRGNTKIGPVLEVTTCCLYGQIWS